MKSASRAARSDDAIGVLGLGLIGGSLARALRAADPKRELIGVESDGKIRALARRDGIFQTLTARPTSALSRCAIVVLCAPVEQILSLLDSVSSQMRAGAIVTDVAGVKESVVAAARTRVRKGVAFVGAHPMFGGETGGYAASRADLWRGGAVAVCTDSGGRRAVASVARFHEALGARAVFCTAAAHDAAVAAISQLPYVVASAMALTARDAGPLARRLAGKGLADATRLAAFAYSIQGEASRQNPRLVAAVRSFGEHLRALLDALAASPEAASAAFGSARTARSRLTARRGQSGRSRRRHA